MNSYTFRNCGLLAPMGLLFAISACGSSHSHANDPNARLEGEPAEEIAAAKCNHESQCGDVGMGQEYETMDGCQSEVTTAWRDDLNKYECPQGISQSDLDECIAEIQSEECGNPIDNLTRFTECMSNEICI